MIRRGQRFGRLKAVAPVGDRRWLFECDCGNQREALSFNCEAGRTQSCGCLPKPPRADLAGKKFGRLLVISYKGNSQWHCRCNCGSDTAVKTSNLRKKNGRTVSCGCHRADLARQRNGKNNNFYRHGNGRTKEHRRAAQKRWVERNPAIARDRRDRRRGIGSDVTNEALIVLAEAQSYLCHWCDDPLTSSKELDHVQPISRGGTHDMTNVVWSCGPCNAQKYNFTIGEWLKRRDCRARQKHATYTLSSVS